MTSILIATLSQVPNEVAPSDLQFEPSNAEVTVDEQGMEILAFDDRGDMMGALVMTPGDDYVQIDASFADGYVSVGLLLLSPEELAATE